MSQKKNAVNLSAPMIDWREPLDHKTMMERIEVLSTKYPHLSVSYLGESMLGRGIPVLTFGRGSKSVLYVGAMRGGEWLTSMFLLRIVSELCELYQQKSRVFRCSVPYLFDTRTVYVIPMLNPDGVDCVLRGVGKDHILYDRLLSMNGGSEDFSHWQANARGVDLTKNFNADFVERKQLEGERGILGGAPSDYSGASPESEPETGYLCNFLRFHDHVRAVLSFHMEDRSIRCTDGRRTVLRAHSIADALARTSACPIRNEPSNATLGGLLSWCAEELVIPAFSIGCAGNGARTDAFSSYMAIREMLLLAPTFI